MTPRPLKDGEITEALGGLATASQVRAGRVRIDTTPSAAREVLTRATERLRCDHLVQIATVDTGTAFELVYHLTGEHRVVLSIHIEVPRDRPAAPTVSDRFPPAGIYERQIHDLFGIVFEGHPDLARIILNEDWPEGDYPLRKDWNKDPQKSYGGVPEGVE